MSRNRNIYLLSGILLAGLLLVAACGSDDDNGNGTTTSEATTTTAASTTTEENGFDEDAVEHRMVDPAVKEALAVALDARPVEQCDHGFDVMAAPNRSIQVGGDAPASIVDSVMIGDTTYYLVDGEDEEPNHHFWLNPIHRGHPVDDLEAKGTASHTPVSAGSGLSVYVIDVAKDGGAHDDHGEFIVSIISSMGGIAQLVPIDERLDTGADDIVFEEWEIMKALETIGTMTPGVISMSFGTFGCGGGREAQGPQSLGTALSDLMALGFSPVASAGNDETNQVVFPAAFSYVASVGSLHAADERSCFTNFGSWVDYWVIGEEVLGDAGASTWSGTSFAAPQIAAELAAGKNPPTQSTPAAKGPDTNDRQYGC